MTCCEQVQSANDIRDDKHAVEILDRICVLLVANAGGKAGGNSGPQSKIRFTHDANKIFVGPDFSLFLCMLLANREGLVRHHFYPAAPIRLARGPATLHASLTRKHPATLTAFGLRQAHNDTSHFIAASCHQMSWLCVGSGRKDMLGDLSISCSFASIRAFLLVLGRRGYSSLGSLDGSRLQPCATRSGRALSVASLAFTRMLVAVRSTCRTVSRWESCYCACWV